MEQLCTHWTGGHEIRYLGIFRISVEKIKFRQNPTRITVILLEDQFTFLIISRRIFLRMTNVSEFIEKLRTHFVFCDFFLSKTAPFMGMWKNDVERDSYR